MDEPDHPRKNVTQAVYRQDVKNLPPVRLQFDHFFNELSTALERAVVTLQIPPAPLSERGGIKGPPLGKGDLGGFFRTNPDFTVLRFIPGRAGQHSIIPIAERSGAKFLID